VCYSFTARNITQTLNMDERHYLLRGREIKSEGDSNNLSAMRELELSLRRENDDLRIDKSISNVRVF
jgi:hypothetical protein